MIDEAVLEELLAQVADEIPVPVAGPEQVLNAVTNVVELKPPCRPHLAKPLMIAAAAAVVVLAAVPVLQSGSSSSKSSSVRVASPALTSGAGGIRDTSSSRRAVAPRRGGSSSGPVNAAKIVKTGTLDLQVPHGTMRVAVNRVTGVTVGVGGYVANSKTSYGTANPTAQITIRVPSDQFETAITVSTRCPASRCSARARTAPT